jgi:DNA-binding phage protein
MDADEPDELDRQLARERQALDEAHAALMGTIRKALDAGRGPSRIARHAGWTREYISKIRDGEAGGPLRRRAARG